LAARRELQVRRDRRLEIGRQSLRDGDDVALLGVLLEGFKIGSHGCDSPKASNTALFMTACGARSAVQISNWAVACVRNISNPAMVSLRCWRAFFSSAVSSGL